LFDGRIFGQRMGQSMVFMLAKNEITELMETNNNITAMYYPL